MPLKTIIFIRNLNFFKTEMNQIIYISKTCRKMFSKFLENYTVEQRNKTPEGFSNNLI
jgi:hypothetical protein